MAACWQGSRAQAAGTVRKDGGGQAYFTRDQLKRFLGRDNPAQSGHAPMAALGNDTTNAPTYAALGKARQSASSHYLHSGSYDGGNSVAGSEQV